MANYKDIHGTTVRNSAGNLTSAKEGELFFDSTNLDFKYRFPAVTSVGAWRTSNSLNTARNNISGATAGTTTATVAFGGFAPPHVAETESWNGSSWTAVSGGDINTARNNGAGSGTSTSALLSGGYYGS